MKLWKCEYDLVWNDGRERWRAYTWSTTKVEASCHQEHWDHIFPGHYRIENYVSEEVTVMPESLDWHILAPLSGGYKPERIGKDVKNV